MRPKKGKLFFKPKKIKIILNNKDVYFLLIEKQSKIFPKTDKLNSKIIPQIQKIQDCQKM